MTQGDEVASFLPPYRVLDLTDEKGVYCTKLLADLGADVLKIEPPSGDRMRTRSPFWHDEPHLEKSLYFLFYNTSKRSITLNLESQQGQELFKELAKRADAVVESLPVGYLKSLRLDYEVMNTLSPRLVMASITPFGQTGPQKDYQSSDLIAMAMSGYLQITGNPDEPPVRMGNEQSHFAPSLYAATGIAAALYHRDASSSLGQYIDVSMQEALYTFYLEQLPVATWLNRGQNVTRTGPVSTMQVPLGIYPCADGWVGLGTVTVKEWDTLAHWIFEGTGNEAVLDKKYRVGGHGREPYAEEITAYVMDFTADRRKDDLFHEGQRRDLVVVPVCSIDELLVDPHLTASGFWSELDHPVVGRMKYPTGPYDCPDIPAPRWAAPLLGNANESIYCQELGLSRPQLTALRTAGVI